MEVTNIFGFIPLIWYPADFSLALVFRSGFFFFNGTLRGEQYVGNPPLEKHMETRVTRVFMIIMEKRMGMETMRGSGWIKGRCRARFVARWMANLLFSPRLFNKNWKNHVLYLIAADLINVAITFAARIPFFLSRTFRTLAEVILWAHIFSYFYIALTIRFGGRFDATNPNRDFLRGIRVCAPSKRPCFHLEKVYGKLASRDIRTRLVSPILEIRNCASIDKFVRASYARYIFSFSINVSPAFSPA